MGSRPDIGVLQHIGCPGFLFSYTLIIRVLYLGDGYNGERAMRRGCFKDLGA